MAKKDKSVEENTNTAAETQAAPAEPKKIKFCEKDSEGVVVSFKFGNGTELTLDLNEIPEETREDLMVHGALQKIGDSYASAGGDYAFAIAAAEKVIGNLRSGLFNAVRSGSGESKKGVGELATALAALQGKEVADVAVALEAATDEQRKALRSHPAVKAKIAELRAVKAAEALAKAGDVSLNF
jgi:hypothetical protein